jgi:hypothetical protein
MGLEDFGGSENSPLGVENFWIENVLHGNKIIKRKRNVKRKDTRGN